MEKYHIKILLKDWSELELVSNSAPFVQENIVTIYSNENVHIIPLTNVVRIEYKAS